MKPKSYYCISVWLSIFFFASCHPEKPEVSASGSSLSGNAISQSGASCGIFKDDFHQPTHEKVFSKETTLFGTEIEFPFKNGSNESETFELYQKYILSRCEVCKSYWKITSCQQNGRTLTVNSRSQSLKIYVGQDPGVIEITTQPLTYQETQTWAPILETLIFGTAKDLGPGLVDPDMERNRWSGHVNVSWPGLKSGAPSQALTDLSQQESVSLLVNFFIDAQNHAELAMGVLGGDLRNALPLAFGNQEARDKLYALRERFQNGKYNSFKVLMTDLFNSYAYGISPYQGLRYSLVNMEHIVFGNETWKSSINGTRLELRGFFTPRNTSEMLSHYRIVNGRLDYLYNQYVKSAKIVSYDKLKHYSYEFNRWSLQSSLSPQHAAQVYSDYLRQAGLDPIGEAAYLRDPIVKNAVLVAKKPPCLP